MEDFKLYLSKIDNIEQLSYVNVCKKRDFDDYDSFYNFVKKHYNLNHLKEHNYIKYVKVMRNIIILTHCEEYTSKINTINKILIKLSENNIISYKDITKFFYKIESIFKILEDRKMIINFTIKNLRDNIFENKYNNNLKLLFSINNLIHKGVILEKYTRKLRFLIKDFLAWENKFDIDHTLIKATNHKRSYLGLRSESYTNNIIKSYINKCNTYNENDNEYMYKNKNDKTKTYFYEKNINIIKLFNISAIGRKKIKGEIDGIILSYDGTQYIIEYVIEVKSSIKATFEDINKIIFFKEYISNYDWSKDIIYENYTFNKKTFEHIMTKPICEWCIYMCVINDDTCVVEKSNIYFYTVLKILDDNFIKTFYVNKDETIIRDKYKIIEKNQFLIDNIFNEWCENIQFDTNQCNVFVSKKNF